MRKNIGTAQLATDERQNVTRRTSGVWLFQILHMSSSFPKEPCLSPLGLAPQDFPSPSRPREVQFWGAACDINKSHHVTSCHCLVLQGTKCHILQERRSSCRRQTTWRFHRCFLILLAPFNLTTESKNKPIKIHKFLTEWLVHIPR